MGRQNREYTTDDVIKALRESDRRYLTLSHLAEEAPVSRVTVKKRVDELEQEGKVEKEQIGNAKAYWLPENAENLTPLEQVEEWFRSGVWFASFLMFVTVMMYFIYVVGRFVGILGTSAASDAFGLIALGSMLASILSVLAFALGEIGVRYYRTGELRDIEIFDVERHE